MLRTKTLTHRSQVCNSPTLGYLHHVESVQGHGATVVETTAFPNFFSTFAYVAYPSLCQPTNVFNRLDAKAAVSPGENRKDAWFVSFDHDHRQIVRGHVVQELGLRDEWIS